jgi:hypothetical protein
MAQPFLDWLAREQPEVRRFEDLSLVVLRTYRAELAEQRRRDGRPLQPRTLLDSHRVLMTFLRRARAEGYAVDRRLLELKRPRVPNKEPTVYHIAQLQQNSGRLQPTAAAGGAGGPPAGGLGGTGLGAVWTCSGGA